MYLRIGIILSLFIVQILTEDCITPNNEKAQCVSLYTCPVLIGALATQQEEPKKFVVQSNCGGTASNPMVCCGSSANFIQIKKELPAEHIRNDTQKINLLPTRRYCGYQHSDDYFRTVNDTSTINEFPWLAKIAFKITHPDINGTSPVCGGSLINTRYVLTAAHCFHIRFAEPVAVHLGEYHVHNKTDCVKEPQFDQECSAPIEILDIEKRIPHPKYIPRNRTNDIALLRLNRTVSYSGTHNIANSLLDNTNYIRPICLPLPGTTFAKVGDILTSSGWGHRGERNRSYVEIKKKSLSTLIANEQCALEYVNLYKNINENQMCTIIVDNSTDFECRGDSGGPLVFSDSNNQWHQEGIISFIKSCRTKAPSVYTRIVNYLDWILEEIEK